MQYAVPQFTDVEDKLIGPLTLKQFLIILGTGGVIMFFWSLLGVSIIFFLFALPIGLLGIGLAFGTYNGRSLFLYLGPMLNYVSKPQARIFKREEPVVVIKMEKKKEEKKTTALEEPAESRLKKLAYLLDREAEEEKELLKGS